MSFGAIACIGCLGMMALGLALTVPEELRKFRWLKIILSIPPVLTICSALDELTPLGAYFAPFSFAILAFIWKSPLAHFGSLIVMRLVVGNLNRPTGIRAEFGAAKAFYKHGELKEALEHTRRELEKEPFSYEGLLLLAQIHVTLEQPELALATLETLLNRGTLTSEQREAVRTAHKDLENSLLVAALNAG